jgi:site-specific DNA-methyltransferase (adenine-specific)
MSTQNYKIGDCLDLMSEYSDDHFDLILTDPPYGISAYASGTMGGGVLAKQSTYTATKWDNNRIGKEYFAEMQRVSKNQIIFGGNYYTDYLKPTPCWIVWDKQNGDNYFADCELAWTSFTTATRLHKYRWQGMLQGNMGKAKEKRIHPTQKPTPLFVWILEKYTKSDDLILDPFMGSGTILEACRKCNLDCLGFEISDEWESHYNKRSMKNTPQLESFW